MSLLRLADNVVIVTGGGSGIGRAVCQLFAKEGASMAVMDLNLKTAQETVETLNTQHNNTHYAIQVDVTSSESVKNSLEMVLKHFGKPGNVLVNSAGISRGGMFFCDLPEDNWDAVLNVNLKGTFLMSKEFVNSVKTSQEAIRGNIINFSSLGGKVGFPTNSEYAASKGGIIALTKSIAREFQMLKVRCNTVMPGLTDTPMVAAGDQNTVARLLKVIPMARMAQPEEIANACLFLASKESSYIHGTCLEVTGGHGV